jgi:hypothetical protein
MKPEELTKRLEALDAHAKTLQKTTIDTSKRELLDLIRETTFLMRELWQIALPALRSE